MKLKYPSITPIKGKMWRLDHTFEINIHGVGLIRVMGGFVCDFGSIPRWAWPIVGHPLTIVCMVAYLIHDALYSAKLVTRKEADLILDWLLWHYGAGTVRRSLIFGAVRAGGWAVWCRRKMSSVRAARKFVAIHPET